jgi:hypothetical protein
MFNNRSNYPPGVTGNEWQIIGVEPRNRTSLRKPVDRYRTKFIANAELIENEGVIGGQRYRLDRELHGSDTLLLTGINFVGGLEIGDKGIIVYSTTPSSGLFYFWKDWTEQKFIDEIGQDKNPGGKNYERDTEN